MIISHKHKFIFIKTRKTAGTSMEMMLSEICGERDVLTPLHRIDEQIRQETGLRGPQNHRIPFRFYSKRQWVRWLTNFRALEYPGHLPASLLKGLVDKPIWDTYFKFAVDRNPFDKVVSYYYWLMEEHQCASIRQFIEDGWLASLHSYDLYAIGNRVAVDRVYRYEELGSCLKDLSNKLNLSQPLSLPARKAKSGYRKVKDYREIIDPYSREQIEIMYAREIRLLDYNF